MLRLDTVRTVFRKELREMLRDRRSLAIMFGIPLLLYPAVAIGIATLGSAKKKELTDQTAKVVINNAEGVPYLVQLMNGQYTGLTAVRLVSEEAEAALKSGEVQAIIDAPPRAQERAVAGEPVELRTRLDRSRSSTAFVERKLDKMLADYKKFVVERRLEMRGVPPEVIEPPKTVTLDISSGQQRFGKVLSQLLPLLLLMTGMLGALFPALNATTTERELGTLETLLVTPAGRTELLFAKGLLVLLCGLLTAGLNMVSMALVLKRATSMLDTAAAEFSVSASALLVSYLAAVPTLVLFTTLVLIMGLLARNFREANAFATPVMLLPLASMAVGISEPRATPAVLVTPVANTTVIIREALTGRVAPAQFLLAFASSAAYAALMLGVAGRLFSNEQLVNPAWEPLSFKGFGRAAGKLRNRLPAMDEAMALFAATLLLMFYVTPSLREFGLVRIVLVNQLLLILAPTLLLAYVARWQWRETFSWRRISPLVCAGGAMLGAGLVPWVQLVAVFQQRVWPRASDENARATAELVLNALQQHPVAAIVATGALAGFCEEMLFRGPMQKSLLRRISPWSAIAFTAFLFGAAHLDLHGMPLRMALGVLLGYVVWRTGSIFPAMLLHGFYDAAALTLGWWAIRTHGADSALDSEQVFQFDRTTVTLLAVGAVLSLLGALLLRTARAPQTNPDETLPQAAGTASRV